jgi:hypothetical protein
VTRSKAQAPVGRLLEWHQWKQATGQLLAVVPYLPPEVGAGLLATPSIDLEQIMSSMEVCADEAHRLKRSGLYVDIGQGSRIREPSEITEAEVTGQLGQARRAVASARMFIDPVQQARVANPDIGWIKLAGATVSVLAGAGYARTPDAAADVMVTLISTARSA